MSNSNNAGALMVVIWLVTISISIGSGILAWNWIDPESFLGVVGFLILWGILSKIGHTISLVLVAIMAGRNDS